MKKLTSPAGTEYVYKGQSIWFNPYNDGFDKYTVYIGSEIRSAYAENLTKAKAYINLRLSGASPYAALEAK